MSLVLLGDGMSLLFASLIENDFALLRDLVALDEASCRCMSILNVKTVVLPALLSLLLHCHIKS